MRVSVAMCTYNGEAYLSEQLDSILQQTCPPDELIICDDGSTDGTRSILDDYERSFPNTIRVHENDTNLGVVKNFEKAIGLTTGDVVALSDQDDVWKPEKLKEQVSALKSHDAQLVFHNAAVVSESLVRQTDLWSTFSPSYALGRLREPRNAVTELTDRNVVQGAATVFKSDLKESALPIPRPWFYDHYIAMIAALTGSIYDLDAELIRYRQHNAQQMGVTSTSLRQKIAFDAARRQETYRRTEALFKNAVDKVLALDESELTVDKEWVIDLFERKEKYAHNRAVVYDREQRTITKLACISDNIRSGSYHSLGDGWTVASKDVLSALYYGVLPSPHLEGG